MNAALMVRVIAGVLFCLVLIFLVQRRRTRVK